jgi:AAA family ATP:ADP antiporter
LRHPVAAGLTIGAAAFFLISGYEFARSASYSLYIGAYGAERLPFVMALSPLGTLAFVYSYSRVLSRMGSRLTLFLCAIASAAAMVLCYLLVDAGLSMAVAALYVVREAYIVLLIEQYWSFINSTLTQEQARRFNGPILGIASVGGILGGLAVGAWAQTVGSELLILFAAASLLPAAGLCWLAHHLGGDPVADAEASEQQGYLALGLFGQHRTLILLAALIVTTQIVATALDIRLGMLAQEAMPDTDERTSYFGYLNAAVNGSAFVLQFLVAPLLLRRVPLFLIFLAIPVVHLVTCSLLAIQPSLAVGAAAYLLFKALDYSIFRASKEILYIPLPFDARYRAKEVIDAFGYRASKGGTSGLLALAGAAFGKLPVVAYPVIALAAVMAWLTLVIKLVPRAGSGSCSTTEGQPESQE